MAQTQKKAQSVMEWYQYSRVLSESNPQVMSLTDWVKAGKVTANALNVPYSIMKSPSAFEQERQQQMQKQQEMENMAQLTSVKDAAAASKSFQEAESIRQSREEPKEVRFEQ